MQAAPCSLIRRYNHTQESVITCFQLSRIRCIMFTRQRWTAASAMSEAGTCSTATTQWHRIFLSIKQDPNVTKWDLFKTSGPAPAYQDQSSPGSTQAAELQGRRMHMKYQQTKQSDQCIPFSVANLCGRDLPLDSYTRRK